MTTDPLAGGDSLLERPDEAGLSPLALELARISAAYIARRREAAREKPIAMSTVKRGLFPGFGKALAGHPEAASLASDLPALVEEGAALIGCEMARARHVRPLALSRLDQGGASGYGASEEGAWPEGASLEGVWLEGASAEEASEEEKAALGRFGHYLAELSELSELSEPEAHPPAPPEGASLAAPDPQAVPAPPAPPEEALPALAARLAVSEARRMAKAPLSFRGRLRDIREAEREIREALLARADLWPQGSGEGPGAAFLERLSRAAARTVLKREAQEAAVRRALAHNPGPREKAVSPEGQRLCGQLREAIDYSLARMGEPGLGGEARPRTGPGEEVRAGGPGETFGEARKGARPKFFPGGPPESGTGRFSQDLANALAWPGPRESQGDPSRPGFQPEPGQAGEGLAMGDGPSPKESPKPLPVPEAAKAPEAAEPPEALKALDALKGRPWAGEGLGPVPQSGLEAVYRDRGFLEWQNRKLLKILLFLCPLALISVLANGLMFVRSPEARYFAVGPDLRVLPLPALSEPILSGPALANWAGQAVIEALSLDFLDYRKKLMEASHNFTPPAFQSFLASLEKGGHLKKIESERLNLACALTDAPVIARSGLERGVMTWKIEMPVVLSFQDSKGILTRQSLLAELLVERVHPSRNPRGLAIRQLVLSKKG